jgi:hypothetical protein
MPPVSKAGGTEFRKDVAFAETKDSDEYELEATGIVMVPDKADLQHDFAREGTIRSFADQFGTFIEAGEASGGVMHAVWPDDWLALERNEVLDESADIGGKTVEAGAWVQTWGINNADLAALIDDDILEGYSIGAIQVDWDGPYDPAEVDDVAVPDALPGDVMVWELTDGLIREVSAVDIPAVPDAEILEAKDLDKRLADHIGNRQAFIDEAMERGHSEAAAERLWDVLNDAMEIDGAGDPSDKSAFARVGRFLSALAGNDTKSTTGDAPDTDPRGDDAEKEGRTLSTANRESVMAQVDAGLDILHDAGMDGVPKRFTDRDDVDFDLSEHDAREWTGDHGDEEQGDDEDDGESTDNHAPGGDTPDDTMSDDTTDDPWADAPAWAKDLRETAEENSKRIDDIADGDADGDGQKDADVDDDPMTDAPEWARELKQDIDEQAERIDSLTRQSGGGSDQVRDNGDDADDGLDQVGKLLS